MELGRALLLRVPPASSLVPLAVDHFTSALTQKPQDVEARREKAIALSFLAGQELYQADDWSRAIDELVWVYDQRPSYLGGLAAQWLYEACISLGDAYLGGSGDDCAYAYHLYSLAHMLGVPDRSVAQQRMLDTSVVCDLHLTLTPTPNRPPPVLATMSAWATRGAARQTPPPVPTANRATRWAARQTPTPTATPWNLRALHNQIIFLSAESGSNSENPEVWVKDPDGGNRRYLGNHRTYEGQLTLLRDEYAHSPDRRYLVSVNESAQLTMMFPDGEVQQITFFDGVCYDLAWSPDGGRIVFTCNQDAELGEDEIWVMRPDGTDVQRLTSNAWEWDRHPSWSPDSRQIAFWSNRNFLKQIYVMDSEGRYPTNISQS